MKTMIAILLLIATLQIATTSCGVINAATEAMQVLGVTTSSLEAKEQKPIDSVVLKFNSVYWKEIKFNECDSVTLGKEQERELKKDGYSIWYLSTSKQRRYEVKKSDTVIYIYRK